MGHERLDDPTTDEVFWVGTSSNPAYEKWRTSTVYDGSRTLVIPPLGAVPTESRVDARGKTVSLTQYERDPETSTATTAVQVRALSQHTTSYEYDPAGQLVTRTVRRRSSILSSSSGTRMVPRFNARRRSSGLRRAVRLLALLTVGSVLAGCATGQEVPDFVPPIVWESSKFAPGPTVPDPAVRVVLREDGVAELTNFPKGRTDGDEKTTCFDPQGDELYSGEARWEVRSSFLVTLEFEDSEVVISSGAQFGEPDWTEVGYAPCDGSVIWKIGLVCGDSGYGKHGPSDSPQAGTFREPCTAEELQ